MMTNFLTILSTGIAVAIAAAPAAAHDAPLSPAAIAANAPFEWLIGDWRSLEGGNQLRQNLSWGPHRSYIKYSTYMQQPGKEERIHFEGIAVWNGKSKLLDYVFAVEPGSAVQERGTIRAEADGSIVREVEFTGADGQTGHFRQTFRKTGPSSAVTSLMRQTATGWEANFPGSDNIVMNRKTD
jgi:hypothetical protein